MHASRRLTPTGLVDLYRALDEKPPDLITEMSETETMRGPLDRYLTVGRSALWCISLALSAARKEDVVSVLDLPSGHGRVLRWLKAAFPEARLTACDIDREGVEFCALAFGATPVVSEGPPDSVRFDDRFDLIWCGSLLNHLDASHWNGFLALFERFIADDGVIVFTVNGRHVRDALATGRNNFGLGPHDVEALVAGFDSRGFGYADYHQGSGHGLSLSSPAHVCAQLEAFPGLRLCLYMERAWGRVRALDAVACTPHRVFEPLSMPMD